MRLKNKIWMGMVFLFAILLIASVTAYTRSAPHFSENQPSGLFGGWSSSLEFDESMCASGQDFVIQIAPFGCSPAVVRSDLLEEQNVPVFCQLAATQINPLIKVDAIETISFSKSQYPPEVQAIGFQPAKAALGIKGQTSNYPVLENIGYAVIVLKKQENASKMPEYVTGNLSAKIKYDIKNAFGIGKSSFYLPLLKDSEWDDTKSQYSFWNGKGYLRADEISTDTAVVSVYDDSGNRIQKVTLKKGETSEKIRLPGFYCLANLRLKLDDFKSPDTRVLLQVGENSVEVVKGESFLEGKCQVTDIENIGIRKKVSIKCKEDTGGGLFGYKSFDLIISPKLKFKVDGQEIEVAVGEKVTSYKEGQQDRTVYLGYAYSEKGLNDLEVFLLDMKGTPLPNGLDVNSLRFAARVYKGYKGGSSEETKTSSYWAKRAGQYFIGVASEAYASITEDKRNEFLKPGETAKKIQGVNVELVGFAGAVDKVYEKKELGERIMEYYKNANDDYDYVIENFAGDKIPGLDPKEEVAYGEESLYHQISMNYQLEQKRTLSELCDKFKKEYPNSKKLTELENKYCKGIMLSNPETANSIVFVNGRSHLISLQGIKDPRIEDYSAEIFVRGPDKTETITLGKDETYYLDDFRGNEKEIFAVGEKTVFIKSTQEKGKVADIYLRYNKEWYWSLNGIDNWIAVKEEGKNEEELSSPQVTTDTEIRKRLLKQEELLDLLYRKSFEDGKRVIWGWIGQKTESITLLEMTEDAVRLRTSVFKTGEEAVKQFVTSDRETLKKDQSKAIGDYSFTVTKINLKKSAYVSVNPGIDNQYSNTTFTFKVGIEQRSIQLTPEKTKEKIENLNKTIKKWEERSESIGRLVKGLKGACLGVGMALTVKNFFANLGGRGIARKRVMDTYWRDYCKKESAQKKISVSECYTNHATDIDRDVNEVTKLIEAENKQAQQDQKGAELKGGFLSEPAVNTSKYMERATVSTNADLTNLGTQTYMYKPKGQDTPVDMRGYITPQAYNEGKVSNQDVKDIGYYSSLANNPNVSPGIREDAKKKLDNKYEQIYKITERDKQTKALEAQAQASGLKGIGSSYIPTKETRVEPYKGGVSDGKIPNVPKDAKVQLVSYGANSYLAVLEKDPSGERYVIKELYTPQGGAIPDGSKTDATFLKRNVVFEDFGKSYGRSYEQGTAEVRYFETEPYKGLPSVVPVDVKGGWYASLRQTIPIGGQIKAYDASGRVTSFFLCHVDGNGLEENRGGDDKCTQINTGTGQAYDQIAGLSPAEAKRLVDNAIKAIEEASQKYKAGLTGSIQIRGQTVKIGVPAVDTPGMECQDLMSPKDCQLLFNVCDPVICPSSRCNLGGAYPVKDPIQTGIIGGIVLCLPNFPEVFIPVCLTGIKAGIDGWLSILTSYRDCLQESLETGKMVGICDEIYSLHSCEFFWRQILPIAKIAIPRLISGLAGGGARGGGEYLGVQNAWNTAQGSMNYFTQYYASNSFKAFQARSTEEVGTDICKAHVSGVYPDSNFFDAFTEPDSPSQFHGRFDEIPMTTATNPPMSQYKVFYHIYAGKDSGAYYRVYLKGSPTSTYYQDTAAPRVVASGFVKKDDYASETKDFTAPSGYKELCINVNGQEECGFKDVSTSFAVNYVGDQYAKEQAEMTNIQTEKECVSGTASIYSAMSPSLEGAADEIINPALYNRGIIRICASENPGKGTDAKWDTQDARWRQVGICGQDNIKCWLDTNSVKEVVKNNDTQTAILSTLEANSKEILKNKQDYEDFDSILNEVVKWDVSGTDDEKIEKLKSKVQFITESYGKVFYNSQKAQLRLERAGVYRDLALIYAKKQQGEESALAKAKKEAEIKAAGEALTGAYESVLAAFSEIEKADITAATMCEHCGSSFTNKCDRAECEAIGLKLYNSKEGCNIVPRFGGEALMGVDCLTKELAQAEEMFAEGGAEGGERRYTDEEEDKKGAELLKVGDQLMDVGHGNVLFVYKGNDLWRAADPYVECGINDCSTKEVFDSLREAPSNYNFKYYSGTAITKEFGTIEDLIVYLDSQTIIQISQPFDEFFFKYDKAISFSLLNEQTNPETGEKVYVYKVSKNDNPTWMFAISANNAEPHSIFTYGGKTGYGNKIEKANWDYEILSLISTAGEIIRDYQLNYDKRGDIQPKGTLTLFVNTGTREERKLFRIDGKTTSVYYQYDSIKTTKGDVELGFVDEDNIITFYYDLKTRALVEQELGAGYFDALNNIGEIDIARKTISSPRF